MRRYRVELEQAGLIETVRGKVERRPDGTIGGNCAAGVVADDLAGDHVGAVVVGGRCQRHGGHVNEGV